MNPAKAIRDSGLPWLLKNSSSEVAVDRNRFWITPMDPDDPGYREIIEPLVERIKATSLISTRRLRTVSLALLDIQSNRVVCSCISEMQSGLSGLALEDASLEEMELTFLQRLVVAKATDAKALRPIPIGIFNTAPRNYVFEGDLDEYLPPVVALRATSNIAGESDSLLFLRFALSTSLCAAPCRLVAEQVLEIGLKIPAANHDWLIGQLFSCVEAETLEVLFLELYKLLEFFFPLDSINDLVSQISYPRGHLELRRICAESLGWTINHQRGVRAAAKFASVGFAEVCLGTPHNATGTSEERQQSARKMSENALTRMAELRHTLVHQTFQSTTVQKDQLERCVMAIAMFLVEAFDSYKKLVAADALRAGRT